MDNGYLIKLDELINDEFQTVAFIGRHTPLDEPKLTRLFYYIVESIEGLTKEKAREVLRIEKMYDGFEMNGENRTVSYNGSTYPLDPETIQLSNYDTVINMRISE